MSRSIFASVALLLYGSFANAQTFTLDSAGPPEIITNGVMFDVVATNDIAITGFDIFVGRADPNNAEVNTFSIYTRAGSHVGFESSSDGWALLDTISFLTPQYTMSTLPTKLNIALQSGDTQAFYIYHAHSGGISTSLSTAAVGTTLVSDANLEILVGTGSPSGVFVSAEPQRNFLGRIHYSLDPAPQPNPTPVPTLDAFSLMGLAGVIAAAGVTMTRRRKQS